MEEVQRRIDGLKQELSELPRGDPERPPLQQRLALAEEERVLLLRQGVYGAAHPILQ